MYGLRGGPNKFTAKGRQRGLKVNRRRGHSGTNARGFTSRDPTSLTSLPVDIIHDIANVLLAENRQ